VSELLDKRPFDFERQSSFPFMGDVVEVGRRYSVGVVGSTGAVGSLVVKLLCERNFPVGELRLFASPNSAGKWVETPYGQCQIEALALRKPPILEVVFMAAGAAVAKRWGWRFAHRGALVIDKSSYFRMKNYAPLVVPEVNGERGLRHQGIISNPNCTTIPLVMALAPLHKLFDLELITVTSFQSVSGAGKKGIAALATELTDYEAEPSTFSQRIAYNIIPWIGGRRGRHSGEEMKIIQETRRILELPRLPIQATAVRVPTLVGHGLAVHAEFRRKVDISKAFAAWEAFPGVKVVDDPSEGLYPTPAVAQGRDEVFVGRLRCDRGRHGLGFFVVADNLRKGAATNALQIAEYTLANSP